MGVDAFHFVLVVVVLNMYLRPDKAAFATELGQTCSALIDCTSQTANSVCTGSVCVCSTGYYDTNGVMLGGTCQMISQLQVTGVTFTSVVGTSMHVSWTPPEGKIGYIDYYKVEWQQNFNNSAKGELPNSLTSTSTMITGLTPGVSYRVFVKSVNTRTEQGQERFTSVNKDQATKPAQPTLFRTSDLDARDQSITLTWSAPSSGVASGYDVEVLDGETRKVYYQGVSDTQKVVSFSDIKNGYTYTVKIESRSQTFDGGNYVLSDVSQTTFKTVVQVPDPPTGVTCASLYDEYITLSWTAPVYHNGDLVQYIVTVLDTDGNAVFSRNTNSTSTTFDFHGLSPGTNYKFLVKTQNERYISVPSDSMQSYCTTKAKMAEKPRNLFISNVESRHFTVSWSEPANIYSQENLGYVVQVDAAGSCYTELIVRCNDCTQQPLIDQHLSNRCPATASRTVFQTQTEVRSNQTHNITGLNPDTNYTVSFAVINNAGQGHAAYFSKLTLEEEPQAPPEILSVFDIRQTSLNLSWSLIGPRPGQVTYTVHLDATVGAPSKTYTVIGYENTYLFANGLEEYWEYSVTVEAKTNVGSPKSRTTSYQNRTLPASPGKVSVFEAVKARTRTDNFNKMSVRWKAPTLLERNGIIKDYFLKHNVANISAGAGVSFAQKTLTFVSQPNDEHFYTKQFDVVPETTYDFEVYAVNIEPPDINGEASSLIVQAPAGFPVSIEDSDSTVSVIEAGEAQENTIPLKIVTNFFAATPLGAIQEKHLIGGRSDKLQDKLQTLSTYSKDDVEKMDNWQTASLNGYSVYRLTKDKWLENLEKTPNGRKRRAAYDTVNYVVGSESCGSAATNEYCNGPLTPDTSFTFVAIVCTNTGCTTSKTYGPYTTAKVPETTPIGMIVGICVAVVVVIAVAIVVVIFLRRQNSKAPSVTTDLAQHMQLNTRIDFHSHRPNRHSEYERSGVNAYESLDNQETVQTYDLPDNENMDG